MEDLEECLICSELPRQDGQEAVGTVGFDSECIRNFHTLMTILNIENEICDWTSCDIEGSFLCCSCEQRVQLVRELTRQLQELQMKLEELRADIKSCIVNTHSIKVFASEGGPTKIGMLREKIVSGIIPTLKHSQGPGVVIKDEVLSPQIPASFDEDLDSDHYSPHPASPLQSDPLHMCKSLRIELQRVDQIYPHLVSSSRINVNQKRKPKLDLEIRDRDFVPEDIFVAHSYDFPSKCKVPGCRSSTRFLNSRGLARHIRDVHKHKGRAGRPSRKHLPETGRTMQRRDQAELGDSLITEGLDVFVAHTYNFPSRCKVPMCRSSRRFLNTRTLSRHIREIHKHKGNGGRPRKYLPETEEEVNRRKIMLERVNKVQLDAVKYSEFPTECKEPNCESTGLFNKHKLKRHIFYSHIRRAEITKTKRVWEECTYPTNCSYPDCRRKDRVFHTKFAFSRHYYRAHLNPNDPLDRYEYPISCPIAACKSKLIFKNKSKLRMHLRKIHNPKNKSLIETDDCVDTDEVRKDQVQDIQDDGKLPSVVCEICGILITKSHMRNHMRFHTGEFLQCDKCPSKFRSNAGLAQHTKSHHSEVPPVFKCSHCPKTFKVKQLLKVHTWRHTGHKAKGCELCSQRFMFKVELDEHKRFVHYEELGLEPLRCSVCGKIFSKVSNLDKHMKTHAGGGRHTCSLCPYNTDRSKDLSEHVSTVHCSEFPYKCGQCGKSFKLERRLTEHEKYHQDDYPFQCHICKRKCASDKSLKVHLRKKHTVEALQTHEVHYKETENSQESQQT